MTTKTDALSTIPKGMEGMISAERPAGKDVGLLGTEGIGRDDILLPRLGLAQKMSPEIDNTNQARYIEGLQFTDLFNSLTRQNYGKGPLHFVILRREDPRWIEFNPIESGGGIKDKHVRANDPRTKFTNKPDGASVKPLATMFYDFFILLLNDLDRMDPMRNIVALSMKSSALKEARHLNLLITQRGSKFLYKSVYAVTTGHETDKKSGGTYAIYKIGNAGWLTEGSAIEKMAAEMYEGWRHLKVDVDVDDDPDSFDPASIERGSATDM